MAAKAFHVQSVLDNPKSFAHHESVSQLWQTKWRNPCSAGTYPFVHGNVEDFETIFETLGRQMNDSTGILFDADRYAAPFLPVGQRLFNEAQAAEALGQLDKAKDLFLRASAVYRIARFPVTRVDSPKNWQAWEQGKKAYLRGAKYFTVPPQEIFIPFGRADEAAGDAARPIPTYLHLPSQPAPARGWPVVLFICGLDSYRTDNTETIDKHLEDGIAVLSLEIPGTGDCPAAWNDPRSPERLFGSILDWIANESKRKHRLDSHRVVARGISTGGYYALRLAHTHASQLLASIAQGAWSHYTLTPGWLRKADNGEYPFAIAEAFTYKLGYRSVDAALADNIRARFSLLDNGILAQSSCETLLVNGIEDTIFPIEDTYVAASHGNPKSLRLVEGVGHMGRPEGEAYLNQWLVNTIRRSYTDKAATACDPILWSKGDNLPSVCVYVTGHDKMSGKSILQTQIPLKWNFTDNDQSPMAVAYANKFPANLIDDADIRYFEEKIKSPLGLVSRGGIILRYVDFAPGYTCMLHRTQSLDFGLVLEGQIECLLDGDKPLLMNRGDVAIQRVTLHAWRNPSTTAWARMVYCLQDCEPVYIGGKKLREDLGSGAKFLPGSDNV